MFQGYSEAEYYERMEDGAPAPSLRQQVNDWVIEAGAASPHIEYLTSPLDSEERNPFFSQEALDKYRQEQDEARAAWKRSQAPQEETTPKPMTREEELEAGRAYNRMNDTECGSNDQAEDPTGDLGWTMITITCDRQAEWREKSYEDILNEYVEDLLSSYPEED
jgi:hypothetical protein